MSEQRKKIKYYPEYVTCKSPFRTKHIKAKKKKIEENWY